jgi:uncharacterized protein (DUF58 family)
MEVEVRRVPSLYLTSLILAFVGAFLLAGLLNARRDLTIASILVFAVVVGAKLWTRWSLSSIACHTAVDRRKLFPGETLRLKVGVENGKLLPVWFSVTVPASGALRVCGGGEEAAGESGLLWYQGTRFEWELSAERRGVHSLGPSRITSGDLLGFYPKEKVFDETHEVIVYPRLVPLRSLPLPRRDFFGVPGATSPVQDPVYILGTRDYQSGRPARYMHWKATARHHRLQEKVFEPSEQEKILIVIETDQFARHGARDEFEDALEVVASVVLWLDQQGCATGLVTNGGMTGGYSPIVPIRRNQGQLPSLLEALARLRMEPADALLELLRHGPGLPWGTSCLYFALDDGGVARAAREHFNYRNAPTLFFFSRSPSVSGEDGLRHGMAARRLAEIRGERAR